MARYGMGRQNIGSRSPEAALDAVTLYGGFADFFADGKAEAFLTFLARQNLQNQAVGDPFTALGLDFEEIGPLGDDFQVLDILCFCLHASCFRAYKRALFFKSAHTPKG